MIKNYLETFLKNFVDYNSQEVDGVSTNLFEKIRQGILPDFITRDKSSRNKVNAIDFSQRVPTMKVADKFSFGVAYCGDLLVSEQQCNIGNVFQIEFEIEFEESNFSNVSMFDSSLIILNTGLIYFMGEVGTYSFETNTKYKIKVIRNHLRVLLYVNNQLVIDSDVSTDNTQVFTTIYSTNLAPPPPPTTFDLDVTSSNPSSGVNIYFSQLDINGNGNSTTPVTRVYESGTLIYVSAEQVTSGGKLFDHFELNGNVLPNDLLNLPILMNQNNSLLVVYANPPVTGSITIEKIVDNDVDDKTIFIAYVNKSFGVQFSQISAGTVGDLPLGEYTVIEESNSAFELVSITPSTFTLSESNTSQTVVITNHKVTSDVGSIIINKSIANVSSEPANEFEYTIDNGTYTDTDSGQAYESVVFSPIPYGSYDITETESVEHVLISITPNPAVINALTPSVNVNIVNNIRLQYGALYNSWVLFDSRKILSSDEWIIPSKSDFESLINFLGGSSVAGGKLKETGAIFWDYPNTGASNSSHFFAKGAGLRSSSDGTFLGLKGSAGMWTNTPRHGFPTQYSILTLSYNAESASIAGFSLNVSGRSIRPRKISTSLGEGEFGSYVGNNGRIYSTVCIGGVEWLRTNLRETHWRTGAAINEITNNSSWIALSSSAFCYYNNDSINL